MTLQKIEQAQPLAQQQKIERVVNYVFAEMFTASKAAKSQYKTDDEIEQDKRTWLKGFIEAGISSREELERGLKHFRHNRIFVPALSEFLSWCKGNEYQAYGLPEPSELLPRLEQFKDRWFKPIDYRSNAEYWLLSAIERKQKSNIWIKTEELQKFAEAELNSVLAKLKQGVQYGKPEIKELDKPSKPKVSPEARSAMLRQKLAEKGVRL